MTTFRVGVAGLSVLAPFAEDLDALSALFAGAAPVIAEPWRPQPSCLAPRAAKRMSPAIRLALGVAERIAPALPPDAGWVFGSSIGEGETLKVIMDALRTPEMMIQPIRFQNAVHNAASGQWMVARGLTGPATSIGAYDHTAGAALLKAVMQVTLERRPVGLVLYDARLPEPFDTAHPIGLSAGAGLALLPERSERCVARLTLSRTSGDPTPPATCASAALLAHANPVLRVLPLFERLLGHGAGPVVLGLHGGRAPSRGALAIEVSLP